MNFSAIAAKRTQAPVTAEQKKVNEIGMEIQRHVGSHADFDLNAEKVAAICEERNALIRAGKAKGKYFTVAKQPYKNWKIAAGVELIQTEKEVSGKFLLGETFPKKEAIKAKGGKWVAEAKAWVVPCESFDELYNLCNA